MYKNQTTTLILASQSPRRRQLLEQMGILLKIIPSDVDEDGIESETPEQLVEKLALLKAQDIAKKHPDQWTLGADTIVVVDDQVLGKPRDRQHAVQMLNMLSSREHYVYTGFCLSCSALEKTITRNVKTAVEFKTLSADEIQWYADTGEPDDKAGAYGIQGKGAFMVKSIQGSYSNVVGLPVCEVFETLISLNIVNLKAG